jgi:hypothetical protein
MDRVKALWVYAVKALKVFDTTLDCGNKWEYGNRLRLNWLILLAKLIDYVCVVGFA